MRYLKKKFKNLPIFLVLICVFFIEYLMFPSTTYAATLLGASDYIGDDSPSVTNITHNIDFVIPIDGHDVIVTDYIRIVMTNFSAVTAPTSSSGLTGAPTYGVSGNVAWITNVTAAAGTGITIGGVTATNPALPTDFDVTIQTANDVSGSIVYDSATISAESFSDGVTARLRIGTDTSSITVKGYTSPKAFVTIMLDDVVAGTTVASSSGNFTHTMTGLEEDTDYKLSMFAEDTLLRKTHTIGYDPIHTLPYTETIIEHIAIPTTISLDETVIYQGDTLTIRGRSHPLSTVTIFVEGNSYSSVIKAPSNGFWSFDFNSMKNILSPGTNFAYARELVVGGHLSEFTQSLNFVVKQCKISDLNCDGFVNLTDFSILMYYWGQSNPSNIRADINSDNNVNLTDFSIMMFYWTG